MNTAYKHLDSKLRIAELSMGQWFGVVVGAGTAIVWATYLSPFGSYPTLAIAVYLGAIPAGAAILSGYYEIDVGVVLRSALTWIRLDGRFAPGAGPPSAGYVVAEPDDGGDGGLASSILDPVALWES